MSVAYRSANLWSGRWHSNPRHPAWKSVICSYLQHVAVSATFRLCRVSPNQVLPALTLENRGTFPIPSCLALRGTFGCRQQRLAWQREPSTHWGEKLNTLNRSIHLHVAQIPEKSSLCSCRFVRHAYMAEPASRVLANTVGSQLSTTELLQPKCPSVRPRYRRLRGGAAWRP